jgi:hypothetical protein
MTCLSVFMENGREPMPLTRPDYRHNAYEPDRSRSSDKNVVVSWRGSRKYCHVMGSCVRNRRFRQRPANRSWQRRECRAIVKPARTVVLDSIEGMFGFGPAGERGRDSTSHRLGEAEKPSGASLCLLCLHRCLWIWLLMGSRASGYTQAASADILHISAKLAKQIAKKGEPAVLGWIQPDCPKRASI